MGIQESKVVQRKPTKAKGNISERLPITEDVADFITQLSTLACLRSTSSSTYEYVAFQKLPFTGHYAALPLCSKISSNSQSVFICYDCATDKQAAYLCEECFEKGNHDAHRFSVFPNNNGWNILFCRCGDEQYLKKKVICQPHAEAPVVKNEAIDKKQLAKFSSYFHEAFKILFGLMQKGRADQLLSSLIGYFQKMTDGNLYFSKIVCQFLLETNRIDGQSSNLKKFIIMGGLKNNRWNNVLRNLSFASQYKISILKQFIHGVNESEEKASTYLFQLIINFAGKTQILNSLAKNENLAFGVSEKSKTKTDYFIFYQLIMRTKKDNTQLWKCLVRNKKIEECWHNQQIMKALIKNLAKDEQYITLILEQLLQIKQGGHETYILQCLMILVPEFFVPSLGNKKSKGSKNPIQKLEKQFIAFYNRVFLDINTHSYGENEPTDLLLILPHFSFGQPIIAKLWQELQKRVEIISKNKQKKVIKEASSNFFQFITKFLKLFMTWDHKVLRDASSFELVNFTKDQKLIQKALVQYFDMHSKVYRLEMLQNVDIYTQKQRNLAKNFIKDNLRYNAKKGKYYNISKKLANNSYNFEQINIGAPFKFTEWQQFVSKRFFTQSFFRLIPQLIKIAQKALMDDIELVKIVSNISACLCLLNRNEKNKIKEVTRNFIKQIPDVRENIYYILAKIRDRLQLDIDEVEEKGRKGTKKVKLDLITQIRDKKFKQIKQRHDKIRMKWLKEAEKLQSDHEQENTQDFCNICKQKDTDKRRFVYPCIFTRNNVVSTMLRSDVTDLDINICLHKMHEDCFEKQRRKGQCPICKFQFNCFLPDKPLGEESYTKNWLRNFENIVTSINLQSGKSFNTDWATIFFTYLVFSKSFKVLLKNTQIQDKQRNKVDQLILMHYKSQLQKWPQLTKQAIKRAEKTVKGQVRRQSNIKKVVKTLVFDLVLQQITNEPIKNPKRVEKKFRELINIIGTENAEKINECFVWSRENQGIKQVFNSNVAQEVDQLFKIRDLPDQASDYLAKTSIKCPMCSKYRPTTWQCLFCSKISCQNCMYPRNHCQNEHNGTGIILHLSNAQYELYHQNRQVQMDSLYRNEFEEGWVRDENPQGWQAKTQEIYNFFDTVLHSQSPFKRPSQQADDSDNQGVNHNRGWNNRNNNQDEFISDQQQNREEQEQRLESQNEQDEQQQNEDEEEEEEEDIPRKPQRRPVKMARVSTGSFPKPAAIKKAKKKGLGW